MSIDPKGRGWFTIPGVIQGERTLKQQVGGLETLRDEAFGKSILDIGCAEGLIADWMGGNPVHGIDLVETRLEKARKLFDGRDAKFWRIDLDYFDMFADQNSELLPRYHTVLLLSILQKLRRPETFLSRMVTRTEKFIALRLPAPVIEDRRSGGVPFDVRNFLRRDFVTINEGESGAGEWAAVFRRK